jgi:hypothetical protein
MNFRKSSISLTFLLLAWGSLFAQLKPQIQLNDADYDYNKRLRFGFSIGLNTMDFSVRSNPNPIGGELLFADVSNLFPGFNVNVVSDLRLLSTLSLRFLPGISFGERSLSFYNPDGSLETMMKLESSFIEMPLLFKYAAKRNKNSRPYIVAGANFRIDMAAYKKLNIEEGVFLRLIKGDVYYEYGFGYDFFLTYFKLSMELKMSTGLFNVLANDYAEDGAEYFHAINRMRSQVIVFAFHFE